MRVKIITNPTKEWAAEIAKEIKIMFEKSGHKIINNSADITICIGGDGTILYAGYLGKLEGKILGIGSKRSYICQLHRKNWKEKIMKMIMKKTDDIFILQYEIRKKGKTILKGKAINDIVVHSNNYRVLGVKIKIDKEESNFLADGVIVSSAIGSTGYAFSAGGKKLKHTSRMIEVVPIAPYRRAFSTKILGPKAKISISVEKNCAFILDGIYIKELKPDEILIIRQNGALKFFKGVGWYE